MNGSLLSNKVSNFTSKMLYNEFAQNKINLKYPDLSLEWKEKTLSFPVTYDINTREFQYKLLNNVVFRNEKLFRF